MNTEQKFGLVDQQFGIIYDAIKNIQADVNSLSTNASANTSALEQLSDVNINSAANGDTLVYNSTTSEWENSVASGEVPLTFSTGLTRTTNTITNNLSTGVAGGQPAIGGTGITDILTLKGTTGNGTPGHAAIKAIVGNNGATTALTVLNSGNVGIGTTSPANILEVNGDALINTLTVGLGSGSIASNTASGYQALYYNTTGNNNAASGYQALYNNTTGFGNAASGYQTLFNNTTGVLNSASGYQSLYYNTTGSLNTASGHSSLYSNTTGSNNTASGYQALYYNTTGLSNTAVGRQALYYNTTGSNNTASGRQALYSNTTGGSNTASGLQALYYNTTGGSNTASGLQALYYNTTGGLNVATGMWALYYNTTGGSNAASGFQALYYNTTGSNNTASGYQALYYNTTGPQNTASGQQALYSNTTGCNNPASGRQALYYNTTGGSNTASGYQALYYNTTGGLNTASGHSSLYSNTTGGSNTASGYQALYYNTTGGLNTASGQQALYSNTTGFSNTASGYSSLYYNTTGGLNTASGYQALYYNTTGGSNTASGHSSLYSNTTGGSNTASGYQALYYNTTGSNNTANGTSALYSNTTGGSNTASGYQALYYNTTGGSNTASGYQALYYNTTSFSNTANGTSALYYNTTGSNNSASGYQALYYNTTGSNNTASGYRALYNNTTGQQNTANGMQTLYNNTTGQQNTASGYSSLYSNTTGINNTASGYQALYHNTTGILNTASGHQALFTNTIGNYNTAYGYQALVNNTNTSNNTALGYQAGNFIEDGTTANSTSETSVFIGASTKSNIAGQTNQIVIGHNAIGNGTNSITLGNSLITKTIVPYGSVGIGVVNPANLLAAYSTNSSTNINPLKFSAGAAINGTGGGNRGFDTSFTSTVAGFVGTDNADQGYGYFLLTITNGVKYTIHFYSSAVNGTLGTIITSSGTNFATDTVQTIMPSTITNNAYTSVTFTATGTAAYIGFAGYRTSGTLSLTISELSVVSGNPDTETGSLIAYKNINVVGGGGTGSPYPAVSSLSMCNIANNFTNTAGFDGILLKLDAGSQYNRLMRFGCNSVGNIIQGSQSADETQYRDIFLQPYGAAIIIGAGPGPAVPTETLLNTYIDSALGAGLITMAEFRNVNFTTNVRSFIRVRQATSSVSSYSSYFGTGQNGNCYIIANDSARNGDIVIAPTTGYVGIGTASPGYRLAIINYITGPSLFVGGDPTNSVSNGIILLQSGRVPQSGSDTTGTTGLLFQHTISAATTVNGGYIYNGREKVFSVASEVDTYIAFATTLANTNNERMRITAGGYVGVGTTSPGSRFSIQGEDGSNTSTFSIKTKQSGTAAFQTICRIDPTGSSVNDGIMQILDNGVAKISMAANSARGGDTYFNTGGNFGIGTNTPSYQLQLSTDSAAKPTSSLWTIASDSRVKENVTPYTKGLAELLKINPVNYDYNGLGGFKKGKGGVGIIAQEIIDILPDSVNSVKGKLNETDTIETGILNFNGHELIYVLVNAIKEQQVIINSLLSRITVLESK